MEHEHIKIHTRFDVTGLVGFADMGFVDEKIKIHAKSILPRINTEDMLGWKLVFDIDFRCANFIGIDKKIRRLESGPYDSFKYKEYVILIAIPIPDNTQAPYGIPPVENGSLRPYSAGIPRRKPVMETAGKSTRFRLLEPGYDQYAKLEQYALASAIKAIDFAFSKGFTLGGKKIKFQDL